LGDDAWLAVAVIVAVGLLGIFLLLAFKLLEPRPGVLIVRETEDGWVIIERPLSSAPAVVKEGKSGG